MFYLEPRVVSSNPDPSQIKLDRKITVNIFQAYNLASSYGRVTLKISRQIYELFELTTDNPWGEEHFGESEIGPIPTAPLGVGSADPTPIGERVKRIKENLVVIVKNKPNSS